MSDLSNDLNSFEQARKRSQEAFDAIEPAGYPDAVPCSCEGKPFGCTAECFGEAGCVAPKDHRCPMNCESGWIRLTEQDHKDARDDDRESRFLGD